MVKRQIRHIGFRWDADRGSGLRGVAKKRALELGGERDPNAAGRALPIAARHERRARRERRLGSGRSAPVRQRATSSTPGKRLKLPKGWQDLARLLVDEMRTLVGERLAALERKLVEAPNEFLVIAEEQWRTPLVKPVPETNTMQNGR